MKKLSNLVPDIDAMLDSLTEGNELDISEETYEEFGKEITAGTGTIKLTLTAAQTANLRAGRNFFDVVLTIGGKKTKVIKGTAIVEESASV